MKTDRTQVFSNNDIKTVLRLGMGMNVTAQESARDRKLFALCVFVGALRRVLVCQKAPDVPLP